MEDANSHPPFQVEVLSYTEHGYPLSSTLRGTSACAVKPFPRHRAKQSQFHGPQRHTTLRGVCLLHPPGTLTLNRSFLLPPFVPGGSPVVHRARQSPSQGPQRHILLRGEAISPSPSNAITIPGPPEAHSLARCLSFAPTWNTLPEWKLPVAITRSSWKDLFTHLAHLP